jgi:hypothetical protein
MRRSLRLKHYREKRGRSCFSTVVPFVIRFPSGLISSPDPLYSRLQSRIFGPAKWAKRPGTRWLETQISPVERGGGPVFWQSGLRWGNIGRVKRLSGRRRGLWSREGGSTLVERENRAGKAALRS